MRLKTSVRWLEFCSFNKHEKITNYQEQKRVKIVMFNVITSVTSALPNTSSNVACDNATQATDKRH